MESVEGELILLDFEIAKLVDPTLAKMLFIFIDSIQNYSSLNFVGMNLLFCAINSQNNRQVIAK